MSIFDRHPGARWAAPAAAVAVIAGTSVVTTFSASADPSLPPRSAEQLLADVQRSSVSTLSGTIVQTADLGLPEISLGRGGPPGRDSADLSSVLTGSHTWRVWYAGPTQARLALVGSNGESDIIRNGKDVWVWSSEDKTAVHHTLSAADLKKGDRTPGADKRLPGPADLPKTPEEAAQRALEAIDPSTEVTTTGTAVVAGRSAYELQLTPRDATSLVKQVSIAVDAERHIPLRVQVFSTKLADPALEVGFTHIDFAKPDARQFAFNAPPGTTVRESSELPKNGHEAGPAAPGMAAMERPKIVGSGWGAVVIATLPEPDAATEQGSQARDQLQQLQEAAAVLPQVSGTWGSGRLLTGTLFSAVLTDDGRVAVGAVAPDSLYAALAAK
jgi:outer membrane lipoprotein-sorting protein